ncbi:MAG: hypothetical protein GY866_10615, partial [Proteobacteria bacterium]|nr:hypothetical protein [Pseudomonadota bacterium]
MLPQIMIAGIVLSFLYYEIVGLSPGGIIVCGYLVLYTGQPHRILSTLLISMLVLATGMLLQKWMVLFGKRKFGIYVLLGIFFSYVASHVSALDLMDWEMAGIGFIIPGLIG